MPPGPYAERTNAIQPEYRLDRKFAWFEVLDRTHCVTEFIEEKIASHDCVKDSEYRHKLYEVLTLLGELYQAFGEEMDKASPPSLNSLAVEIKKRLSAQIQNTPRSTDSSPPSETAH